ncbi:gamma carbonic anhydrase family protein [Halomonas sp. M5N1S17]|uniref:gamma carbonic anhydrase family protein n=1 Tax=Halomonas alkalisoli TaxID=2907158 RepID=UPI001F37420E|nr:gamma carbonic anhydrase family protein [Halomonas alkalisoli]MCE9665255.1 gamma carbonic anhydrase family protein [Halomonas alkalisoli]MCE9683754.1 gamma carbonic anhydrase family protein [Halomonas alkalisoli]
MATYALDDLAPTYDDTVFIAREAAVIGDARLARDVSIWPGAVLRGDNEAIVIGAGSNIQENCVLHTDPGFPMEIGEGVTVGHLVMLHGCTIGNGTLIGMHSTVLNGARIGDNCLIGAGSVITSNKDFPDNSLILGSPAKVVRTLSEEEIAGLTVSSKDYVARKNRYLSELTQLT